MKVIDEKGRLFGKLNLIDLLVILLIVFAAVAAASKKHGYRRRNDPVYPMCPKGAAAVG